MLRKIYFSLFLIVGFAIPSAIAQPFDPCDPMIVADLQTMLISEGYDCLEGAGPFICVEEVIGYVQENCPGVIDTTGTGGNNCDPVVVADLQAQMIADGFDCLVGAGPFACVEEVFAYADANCFPIDTSGSNNCDPAEVDAFQEQMIADGFDCLVGAGPFTCFEDVVNYADANCPIIIVVDSTDIELPLCLQNIPAEVVSLQQFFQYAAANCDSIYIPECFLTAPTFATDEEFVAWLNENCTDDFGGFASGEESQLLALYNAAGSNSVLSTKAVNQLTGVSINPNPATTAFVVRISGKENISRVDMLNYSGQTVFTSVNPGNSSVTIPVAQLPQGIYLIKVQNESGQLSIQKGIKQ